jgi:serine/threonine-protein kinase
MPDPSIASALEALSPRYRIDRELGSGGMSHVYLARDLKHDRAVALKVLKRDLAARVGGDRFLREIRIAAQLNHPHILPLHDSGDVNGLLFYVMPYAEGETLRERLKREVRLPFADAVRIVGDVADAIDYAHRQGVIHRDLKPGNILLHEGHAIVADFGVARAVNMAGGVGETETGITIGTPAYMSPEQAAGDAAVDGRSDVYSLACVFYEMLVGVPPFTGPSALAIMTRRFSQEAPNVRDSRPDISDTAARAIAMALARDPVARQQTATAFADALRSDASFTTATAAVTRPSAKSMVVLPFANLSADADNEYFSDGLTDELIANLSRLRSLKVISRISAMSLKGTTLTAPQIGRDLGVGYVLQGSVRKAGPQLRITAQLTEAATDTVAWAETYSGSVEDVFDLQERVSREIARALDVTLTADEDQRLSRRSIADPVAFDYYLRARHELMTMGLDAFGRADALFKRGLEIAPDNPVLSAGLAYLDVVRSRTGGRPDAARLDRAAAVGHRILATDDTSAPAHLLVGTAEFERGHLQTAATHLKQAVASDPGDAEAWFWLGLTYLYAGKIADARVVAQKILERDPLSHFTWGLASIAEWFDGRYAEGLPLMERCLQLIRGSGIFRWMRGYVLALNGRLDDAAAEAARIVADEPQNPYSYQLKSLTMAMRGDRAGACLVLKPLDTDGLDHHTSFHMAESCAMAGDHDHALDLLSRAVGQGFHPYAFIAQHDRFLDPLRADGRFQPILAEAKRRWESFVV